MAKLRGCIRARSDDFLVDEIPAVSPDGDGEHVWLHVRKRDQNTAWVAAELARFAGIAGRDVSYAGLKDRYAVTTQWFSLGMPGRSSPTWADFDCPGVEILEATRHSRKLRRGILKGNRFRLVIRELEGDIDDFAVRVDTMRALGCPNAFGEQRFGRNAANLAAARSMFEGRRERNRHKRGLYLSAARASLFNRVLEARIQDDTWHRAIEGEVLMLNGTHSVFPVEVIDQEIESRLGSLDLHPTGPLWGAGATMVTGEAQALEGRELKDETLYREGLERAGMRQERRALRIAVAGLEWRLPADDILELDFELPAGSYATTVVDQLIDRGDY